MAEELWAAVIGAFFGFISTYLAAVVKLRQELRAEYDKDLRVRRLDQYAALWKLTAMFPKYGRTQDSTLADLGQIAVSLRDWYFGGGGMYLTDTGRSAYFALQEELQRQSHAKNTATNVPISEAQYETIRTKCSELRTVLVRDVGTRKDSELVAA